MMRNKWKLAATLAVPVLGGTIAGALANKSSKTKYEKLKTPAFAPPGWVFPVVWTSLYTTMGIAKYQFDKTPKERNMQVIGNTAYSAQLGFNFLWSFLYFRWNLRGTALIDALLLLSSVSVNTYYFNQKSKLAGRLMMPYVGWTAYAALLNGATWSMNKDK